MPRRQLPAIHVLIIGLGLIGLGQLLAGAPTAPLYDGLVVEEPYRYVDPPPGGSGDPFAASDVASVVDGAVPLLAVATNEVPPQAQMLSQADAFVLTDGTSSVAVSVQPLAPGDSRIAGNIYRFAVTDQAGAAMELVPGAVVSIVLRAPQADPGAMVARLEGDRWVALPTDNGGLPDLYAANITQLGDFAVLWSGAAPTASANAPSPTAQAPSPSPSGGSSEGAGGSSFPTWLIALFAIGAVAGGLIWGLVVRGEED